MLQSPILHPESQPSNRSTLTPACGLASQQLPDPAGRQIEQPVQHRPVERLAIGGALHLDETIECGYLITAGGAEVLPDTLLWIQK